MEGFRSGGGQEEIFTVKNKPFGRIFMALGYVARTIESLTCRAGMLILLDEHGTAIGGPVRQPNRSPIMPKAAAAKARKQRPVPAPDFG
jgi:hypothetical protein